MRVAFPNRAYLADMERFLTNRTPDGSPTLTVDFSRSLFSLHPLVLCMLASMAQDSRRNGGDIQLENVKNTSSLRYLERMKLFDVLGTPTDISVQEHEPAGRFIPLSVLSDGAELTEFLTEFVPLLHAGPAEAMTVRYVLAELVRNTIEHSGPPHQAFVAAQITRSGRLLLGVSDSGVGIHKTITRHHTAKDDHDAIIKAFEPGISGATAKFGGNENNGGAGLFFMKAMAVTARCHMVAVSGDSMMKLLLQRRETINPSLADDRVRWRTLDVGFTGTAVGIDIQISEAINFQELLRQISKVYDLRVREVKKQKRKARFA